jgi:biofilm PGA synthesis N-glycosyltransferase PgaC
MQTVFWLCFVFIFYVYFGYPALLFAWRRVARKPVRKGDYEPHVTIVIAAHNERQHIEAKLRNCLNLDYPKNKLQIIVSLDGPTDGTEFLVWKYVSQGVEIVHSKTHAGKATALNRALNRAKGAIVVFADARQIFNREAVRALVANFADETVGAVTGELLLMDESRRESTTEVGVYWRYEKMIRSLESDVHSLTGATGAIYAIRRDLYQDLPEDTILDDVLTPLRIVLKGKRTVFEPEAKAYDTVACCADAEYRRKVRTLYGNYQLLTKLPQALIPGRNPAFIQLVSHKVARLLVPWALVTLFVTNLFMPVGIYALTLALQVAWYTLAAAGYFMSKRHVAAPILIPDETRKAA